jgi:hypothetical protein
MGIQSIKIGRVSLLTTVTLSGELGWIEISAWQEIRREHQGSDGRREEAS